MTKADLKGITGVDTSNLTAKPDLTGLKAEVDKTDTDKLKSFPADLSNLSNIVDNVVVKKIVYDKLVTKVNALNTSGFVLKTQYNTNKSGQEKEIDATDKKIPGTSGLVTNSDAKITKIEGKIPFIIGLATTAALSAFENTILNVSDLVKQKNYDVKRQKLRLNILLLQVIVNLRVKYLTQR